MIKTLVKESVLIDTKLLLIRYAYADEARKTYFISKHQHKKPVPNTHLLFVLLCEKTINGITTPDLTRPITGSIVDDIHGNRLKVIDCQWY